MAVSDCMRTCARCGADFRRYAKGQPVKFCGLECKRSERLESYRRRPKRKRDYRIYTNIRGIKCAWCHSLLTKRADYRAKNNFCSATCYQKNRKSKVNKLSAEVHALRKIAGNVRQEKYEKQQKVFKYFYCRCGNGFVKLRHSIRKLCDFCLVESNKRQRDYKKKYRETGVYRTHKQKEKAKRRTRTGHIGIVDPFIVFARNDWTCQGCGCATPETLRGTNDDNAPELDHVTALAKGGSHTYDNTQTLCRVCNILKADKDMNEFMQEHFREGKYGGGSRSATAAAAGHRPHLFLTLFPDP